MTAGTQQDEIRKLYLKLKVVENNAYSSVLAAFRAQGEITWEKQRILSILQRMLDVSPERHSAEMIRVESDPLIQQIAKDKVHEKRLDIRALVEKNDYEARLNRIKNQYTLAQQRDTDSESEEYKKPPPKRSRGPGRPPKKTPQKRDHDEAFASPATTTTTTKRKKKKTSTPTSKHPVLELIEEYKKKERDFTGVNDVQILESIAEEEHKQMEHLEEKFKEFKTTREISNPLGLEIQRKRDRMIKLVEKLENAAVAGDGM